MLFWDPFGTLLAASSCLIQLFNSYQQIDYFGCFLALTARGGDPRLFLAGSGCLEKSYLILINTLIDFALGCLGRRPPAVSG